MHQARPYEARRHICEVCNDKRAVFVGRRGRIRARTDHPLCQRCYRAARNRARAEALLARSVRPSRTHHRVFRRWRTRRSHVRKAA